MKKVLLISGSPRKGNTEFVLSEIAKKLEGEKELVLLRKKNIQHCLGCLTCYQKSKCVLSDDMKNLFNKLLKTDLIIIGSPLYYGNVSAMMKNFIDRTIPAYESELLKGKKIVSIMVGGDKIQITAKFHKNAIAGFVKCNQLELIEIYNFQAQDPNDIAKNPEAKEEIEKIKNIINNALL